MSSKSEVPIFRDKTQNCKAQENVCPILRRSDQERSPDVTFLRN
jgi:hypothetical protein